MKLIRYSLNLFLFFILSLLTACSGSDNIRPSSKTITETEYHVSLLDQTAVPAVIFDMNETSRLRATRQWNYAIGWNVNAYISQNDVITFLTTGNGGTTTLGTVQVAYRSSGDAHYVSLLRQSGSLSMSDLNLTIATTSSPVSLTLTSSGENSRTYQFTKSPLHPVELLHQLTLSNLDILTTETVQARYAPQGGPALEITDRLHALVVRDDVISMEKIDSPDNTALTRTLEQHLNVFFNVLFLDTDNPLVFKLQVQGQIEIEPSKPNIYVPLATIPDAGSAALDTLIPAVATSIKTLIISQGVKFNQLKFIITVMSDDATAPILELNQVILDMTQVADVN